MEKSTEFQKYSRLKKSLELSAQNPSGLAVRRESRYRTCPDPWPPDLIPQTADRRW
jgi:hypothetical protein